MDEESINIHRREEALARFRESLSRPLSERFFDEDELIDFFDFAGDLNDDYLRLEVLICAARFYPDSEDLLQRKAIFHAQFSDESRYKCVEDNPDQPGMIWDIMRAKCADPQTDEDKRALLDQLLNAYTDFTDEEVIQLVDLASTFAQLSWLKDRMPQLREKSQFDNVLLYEVAIAADYYQDTDFAISLLEELTELEPFNAGFWSLLAKEYASSDDFDKAINAIDYSLAIEPNDAAALYLKAKILYAKDSDREEIKALLRRVIEIDETLIDASKMYAFIHAEQGDKETALRILGDYIKKFPSTAINIVPDMLEFSPDNADELLDAFYKANEDNSQMTWSAWAHHLMSNGQNELSQAVLDAYNRNSGDNLTSLITIENLFVQQKFTDTIDIMSKYLDKEELSSLSDYPSMVIMHIVSMIKIGEYVKAYAFCLLLESKFADNKAGTISQRLEYVGMSRIVTQIKNKLKLTMDPADWVDFDPLGLWSDK